MYTIGETVIYGAHGVCIIEDIQEQTFGGVGKAYYVLRSHHNPSLKLFYPVETENSKLTPIASKQKAEMILATFKNPPSEWMERPQDRANSYHKILESENVNEIAQMLNTILRKKNELEADQKKLSTQEVQVLKQVTPILTDELAVSLRVSSTAVLEKIEQLIKENN